MLGNNLWVSNAMEGGRVIDALILGHDDACPKSPV